MHHVFVIVLENESRDTTFGTGSPATYLNGTLLKQGAYLPNYYGIGHASAPNYLAMLSGQAPNADTQNDCDPYSDFAQTGTAPNQQAQGKGCVYPTAVKTLADQLTSAGYSWKSYNEDMGNDPSRESATCGHPPLNASDPTQAAEAPKAGLPSGDEYAARHNPFVYFHSIIDTPACAANVVSLGPLQNDLQSVATTANLTFVTPNLCHDGHDAPCKDGEPGGLVSADRFLQATVPLILNSPAYKQDGVLMIVFDESAVSWIQDSQGNWIPTGDSSACCNELAGPNVAQPGISGMGGGLVGAVVLSPFIKAGTITQTAYNHYALLKSIETLFGLPLLGYAGAPGVTAFGSDVFTNTP